MGGIGRVAINKIKEKKYSDNWPEIAKRIKDEAGWKCEACHSANSVVGWRVLTVHHLDGDIENDEDWNLAALCQRCHLSVQSWFVFGQESIFNVPNWLIPHIEGWEASRCLSKTTFSDL